MPNAKLTHASGTHEPHGHLPQSEAAQPRFGGSEAHLQMALEAAVAGAWSWDVATGQIAWDDNYRRIHGIAADAPPEWDTWMNCVQQEDRPKLLARVEELLQVPDENRWNEDFRLLRPDGAQVWMQSLGRVERDAEGRPIRFVGITLDITERKQNEIALGVLTERLEEKVAERTAHLQAEIGQRHAIEAILRARESNFRAIFRHAPVGLVQLSMSQGRLEMVNPAFCDMLGFSEAELLGRQILEVTHPEDRETTKNALRNFLAGKVNSEHPVKRYLDKDGNVVWAEIHMVALRGTADIASSTIAVVRDINKRKQLENELCQGRRQIEAERNFISAVMDTQSAMVAVLDSHGRLIRYNRTLAEMLGPKVEKMHGTSRWCRLLSRQTRANLKAVNERLVAGESWVEHEDAILDQYGQLRTLLVRDSAIRDDQGNIQYFIGTAIDITEQRQAEMLARNRLDEVCRLQRQHTAEELASTLAHELNQPLAAIAAYMTACRELLNKPAPDRDLLHAALERIHQQSLRAGDIIQHMRRFVANGSIKPEPLDLNALVRGTCELMALTSKQQRIRLVVEPAADVPSVMATAVQVEQVLVNLLRNAFEATAKSVSKDGKVLVQTRLVEGGARVTVRDNGPGVTADSAQELFEGMGSHKPNGLGLGLRISRSLIEAHGGRIWVEPHVPGAIFHFELPLARCTKE